MKLPYLDGFRIFNGVNLMAIRLLPMRNGTRPLALLLLIAISIIDQSMRVASLLEAIDRGWMTREDLLDK